VINISELPIPRAGILAVTPAGIDFGTICMGYSPVETIVYSFTLAPDGGYPFRFVCEIVSPVSPFSRVISPLDNDCAVGRRLAEGETCNIGVQFSPSADTLGARTSSVIIRYYGANPSGGVPPAYDPDSCGTALPSHEFTVTGFGMGLLLPDPPPVAYSYGNLCLGSSSDHSFTVTNNGACTYALGTIGSPSLPFSRVEGTCSDNLVLDPGATCSLPVRFAPSSTGSFDSSFLIPWAGSPINITVSGTAGGGHLTVPANANFGNVCLGSSSDQTITITNDSQCPSTLGRMGSLSAPFTETGGTCTSGMTLNVGQSCTISVRFTPTSSVPSTVNLSIGWGPTVSNVILNGRGVINHVAVPANVNFGNLCVGSSSDQTITVTNDTTCPAAIGTIGSLSPPFSRVGGTCTNGMTLNGGQSCTISVRFTPLSAAPSTANLSIPWGENVANVSLNGAGIGGHVSASANANFGDLCVESSSDQTITVTNDSSCPAALGTIGSLSPPFSRVGGSCTNGMTLNGGQSCTTIVRFTPSASVSFSASLTIPWGGSAASIDLRGTGKTGEIVLAPTDVDFGNVLRRRSLDQMITVGNNGSCPLILGTMGEPQPPFRNAETTCSNGMTLSPGASCTVLVRFTPAKGGAFTSGFAISSSDSARPEVTVRLNGGSGCDLEGKLEALNKVCKNTSKGIKCVITGSITVEDKGFADCGASCVKFFLSDDVNYNSQTDQFLKDISLNPIKAGKKQKGKFTVTLPIDETGEGRFILGVIDSKDVLHEADRSNNVMRSPVP
jgi:hypothetical protein